MNKSPIGRGWYSGRRLSISSRIYSQTNWWQTTRPDEMYKFFSDNSTTIQLPSAEQLGNQSIWARISQSWLEGADGVTSGSRHTPTNFAAASYNVLKSSRARLYIYPLYLFFNINLPSPKRWRYIRPWNWTWTENENSWCDMPDDVRPTEPHRNISCCSWAPAIHAAHAPICITGL